MIGINSEMVESPLFLENVKLWNHLRMTFLFPIKIIFSQFWSLKKILFKFPLIYSFTA